MFGGEFVEIRLIGDFFDDCLRAALAFAEASGGHMVPPFDHKDIIEGQATVGLRDREQMPDGRVPDIDGAAGRRRRARGRGHPLFRGAGAAPRFVFCEPAGAPSLTASLAAGRRVKLAKRRQFRRRRGGRRDRPRAVPAPEGFPGRHRAG